MKRGDGRFRWQVLVLSLIAVYAVAFVGNLFVSESVNSSWYLNVKPSITPPNFVFPIIWNILFILIAFSLTLSWSSAENRHQKIRILALFGINFLLNVMWSLFYFGLRSPAIAFVDVLLLFFSIIIMIVSVHRINKNASYLLIPYLVWVGFAALLNLLSL